MLDALKAVLNSPCKRQNSFAAAQRIPRSEGYENCLKSNVISDSYYKLFFVPNKFKRARIGIVIAKRYLAKSVDRSKAKREVRELFRTHQIKSCGIDIVVMARNKKRLESRICRESLNKLFNRVAMRCKES